jgi:hypothetical protein
MERGVTEAEFHCGGCGAVIVCTREQYLAGAIVPCAEPNCAAGADLAWHSSHAGPWDED